MKILSFVPRRGNPARIGILVLLCIVLPVITYGGTTVDADIFVDNDSIKVWIDLSAFVSAERVDLLQEGIDITLECRADFFRPRRFWGATRISRATKAMAVGYHLLSEEYSVTYSPPDTTANEHRFAAIAGLHNFLADSVVIPVIHRDSVDSDRRYYIEITITCISMTSLNLASSEKSGDYPMKYLFGQFLDLTNYGRDELVISSDIFRISELRSER